MKFPEQFVLYDTEYTAWKGSQERNWSKPGEYREIVQIGAIKVCERDLNEVDSFTCLIKPVFNPQLSDYFVELTGITQVEVDMHSIDLESAAENFKRWCADIPLYSWGGDEEVIKENFDLLALDFPFSENQFFDIRSVFEARGISTDGYMSSTIVQAFDQEPVRTGHNALNDARSILDALRLLYTHGTR